MFVPHRKHTVCYGDGFTCLYVDDVHTLQETNGPPRPVGGDTFSFHFLEFLKGSGDRDWFALTDLTVSDLCNVQLITKKNSASLTLYTIVLYIMLRRTVGT
jgi:hypothetical protein